MSSAALELGEIIAAEVRDAAGVVTDFSHEYPVDASGLIRIPSLSPISATGMELTPQLRDTIADRFVADGIFASVTVNLTLSGARVDFDVAIQPGDTLFVRLLNPDGTVDPSSGSFPVDASGSINLPFLGGVFLLKSRLFEAEHQIEQGLLDGGFFTQPLVNVTRVPLV